MDGVELRRRLDQLKRPYTELAPLLGLSIDGLHKQMRGERKVSHQTEIILRMLESLPELNQKGRWEAQRQMAQLREWQRTGKPPVEKDTEDTVC